MREELSDPFSELYKTVLRPRRLPFPSYMKTPKFVKSVPFRTLLPHAIVSTSRVTIDIIEWASVVCQNYRVVFPECLIWFYESDGPIRSHSEVICEEAPAEEGSDIDDNSIQKEINDVGSTFVICRVYTDIRRINPLTDAGQHVITVFLYRADGSTAWKAVVCDPNWNPYAEESELHSIFLIDIGQQALRRFVGSRSRHVEPHRCINVNVCIPETTVRGGICYTGLCATMLAVALEIELHPEHKAADGESLMKLVFKASSRFRPVATSLVAGYHSGAPRHFFRLLNARARSRSRSPTMIGKKMAKDIRFPLERKQEAAAAKKKARKQ